MRGPGVEFFPSGLAAVSVAAGLGVASAPLWGLSLAAAILFLFRFRSRRLGALTRFLLALAVAAGLAAGFAAARSRYERTRALPLPRSEYITCCGRLAAFPRLDARGTVLLVDVRETRFHKRRLQTRYRLRLQVPGDLRHLSRGSAIRAAAKIRPAPPLLISGKIHFCGRCKSPLQVRRHSPGPLAWRLLGKWRNRLRGRLERRFSDGAGRLDARGGFLEALLLGDRGRIPERFREALLDAGVYHLVAISGAHVGILLLLSLGVMKLAGIPGPRRLFPAMVILLFYLAVAGFPVSAVRAALMAGIIALGRALDQPIAPLRSLSIAGFFMLAADPLACQGAGFVLTFALAAGILAGRGLTRALPGWLPGGMREALAAGVNAAALAMPLGLRFFQRFALVAPLSGMVLLAVCMPVLALGLPLLLGCGVVLEPLAGLLKVFTGLVNIAASLDTVIRRPAPGVGVLLALGSGFLLACGGPRPAVRRAAGILLAVMWVGLALPASAHRPGHMEVHCLDVGQGDSACVVFPNGDGLLIDGGGSRDPLVKVGRSAVLPFLLERRIRVRWMAVSHFHPDHAAGILELLPLLRPEEVWISSAPAGDPLYLRLIRERPASTRLRRVTAGPVLEVAGCRVRCLHPADWRAIPGVRNEDSQILLVTDGRHGFLFTGDAGEATETVLLQRGCPVVAVLKAGHHGSARSSSGAFLDALLPRLAVVSCSAGNPFGFPHSRVLERLSRRGIPWLCTAWSGHVSMRSEAGGIRVRLGASTVPGVLIFTGDLHMIH